jgi:hypothetical protein
MKNEKLIFRIKNNNLEFKYQIINQRIPIKFLKIKIKNFIFKVFKIIYIMNSSSNFQNWNIDFNH